MDNLDVTKKAYKDILETIKKYDGIVNYDYEELTKVSNLYLFGIELKEKYGLNIEPSEIFSLNYNHFGEYMSIGWWGEKYNRDIGCPDNGKKPKDELLLSLWFPTGAFIFGEDYPKEIFWKFWEELKKYNPKYIDTINSEMYFSMKNARNIFNEFPKILEKYYEINETDKKQREIKGLQEKLNKLQNEK